MLRIADEFHGSHTGRQRRANEDSLYARAPLFAVADGMGGAQAGEIASGIAVETLGAGMPGGDSPEARLAEVVKQANGRIYELSRSDETRAGMGTTMTVLLVGEDDVTVAHVGDSRAYRLRDGEFERMTEDHSLVEEFLRQGKLTVEEARNHPQRSVITRALGPDSQVEVDTATWPARPGDTFLICSDGLTTMVEESSIADLLRETTDLEAAGSALIDAANAAGGRDNITVILFRLDDVDGPAAKAPEEQPTTAGRPRDMTSGDVNAALAASKASPAAPAEPVRAEAEPHTAVHRVPVAEPAVPADPEPATRAPTGRRLRPTPPQAPVTPADGRRDRPRWRRRALIALALLAFVGLPVALGSLLALRSVYFVGSDAQGFVTIYRGLPYELPLGIDLYQTNYTSGVSRDLVPEGRQDAIGEHELRSRDDAYDWVRQLERGRLVAR